MKMKKKKVAILLITALLCLLPLAGCGSGDKEASASVQNDEEMAGSAQEADKKAADEVAALIDAIYVQEWTADTDRQCAEAKAAWDALTDKQKKMVEGENADPDYFGRDTGDASKDDPRNQDGIGENEILVVSFGTSFNDSRAADIKGIEDALQEAYPDWSVRRAFTAQTIINHIQARDGECIDNMEQALERAVDNGVKNLVIQPTHLMHGAEYDELMEAVEEYRDEFETIKVAEPLLGEVGTDAEEVNDDKEAVAAAVTAQALKDAGYESIEAAKEDKTAFVFIGHGTSHTAKVSYSQMQTQMEKLGYDNVFIGTVEGEPEETACEAVAEAAEQAGYTKIVMRPLMVVAGDHANNDMAGDDEDSWINIFKASGNFESVDVQISGLGSIEEIQKLYVAHTAEAMKSGAKLPDGVYTADFNTDSTMFRVNEACGGKGTLTVKNGKMTIHISLGSKNIVNLYPGLAQDAQQEGAELLMPATDSVTYDDGMTEEVYGFDVPVPALDEEFDLAIIGTKGVWYDHKVSVSNPEPLDEEGGTAQASALEDGVYTVELDFEGGSGKAYVLSPATLNVSGGNITALIEWSSPNYDYMLVDGEKYLPVNTEGNSVFEIPISAFDEPLTVVGDTVAMSKPHEIEYKITFYFDGIKPAGNEESYVGSMELKYAGNFSVDCCKDGSRLIKLKDGSKILVLPEDIEAPACLDKNIIVLKRPVENIYLVASAAMDMFRELDAVGSISFSSQKADGWYIEEAKNAMESGKMLYAGKYSMPDYELILSKGCELVIENTMIFHSPEVMEKLEEFGIPTIVDYSSQEKHPLGRVEWIKFYGALLDKEDEAARAFETQEDILAKVSKKKKTGKTAAFFYITANGTVNVRTASDYIAQMIELAGGKYVFDGLASDSGNKSSMNISVEEFYAAAKDADYLIYNSAIDGEIRTLDELTGKNGALGDLKAVKEKNVWCTTKDFYQNSMAAGYFMEDVSAMLSQGADAEKDMNYLYLLK